jgi:hypothetical protein
MATKYHTLYQVVIIVLAIIAFSRPPAAEPRATVPETEQQGQLHAGTPIAP